MQLNRPAAYGFLFAGMAVVGSYVALTKPLAAAIPIFLLALLRFAIAAVAMVPWSFTRTGELPPTRRAWGQLFLQSFFGNFLFSICMLHGVALTSASSAGIILATLPAVVAVFSAIFLRERLTPHAIAAVLLAVAGIAVLQWTRAGADGADSERVVLGNLLVFGSVCCEATYVIIGKRLTASLSAMRISALTNLFGLLLMLPFGVWQALRFDLGALRIQTWELLACYALAASMVSTWLWLSGLKHVPANHAGVFTVALPLAATAIGVGWLGETLTSAHLIAFACAVGGIVLIAFAPQPNVARESAS
ncbi:MAG: DMT family transporter [Betaproteobacteria bacterium]